MKPITRTVLQFVAGFLVVLAVSAVLAPWLYTFLPYKFDRILRRLIMIGTIALSLWLLRVRRESLGRMGLDWGSPARRLFGTGFLVGIFLVVLITLVQWGLGARIWRVHETDGWHWIGLFFKGFGAGVLIGAVEEFFFRGFLFLLLKDLWNTKGSLMVTNLIYALVHFFPKQKPVIGAEPTVMDSLRILGSFGSSFQGHPEVWAPVVGLFLFGLLLSFAFLRTGSLFLPIGIHSGCVFGLKMNRRFFPDLSERMGFLSGTKNLYDGIAGLTVLALFAGILGFALRPRSRERSYRPAKNGGAACLIFLFSIFLLCPPPVWAKKQDAGKKFVYSFADNLGSAEALRASREEMFPGAWKDERFHFEGLPDSADILVDRKALVERKPETVVWFPVGPEQDVSLTYTGVPVGRRLRFLFLLSGDWGAAKKGEPLPLLLEVWIGKKKLFETQISTPGWKEKTFDLTLPYLLQRKFRFTVKARTLGPEWDNLIFFGYLE